MLLKRQLTSRQLDAAKVAALAVALGLCVLLFEFGRGLARLSYDVPFAIRPDLVVSNVIVIYLDDPSHQHWKIPYRAPWDRTLHARLLTNLVAVGARAVALDILLDDRAQHRAQDEALAKAIRFAEGKVVLAAKFNKGLASTWQLAPPLDEFRSANDDNLGFIDFDPAQDFYGDGVVRLHQHQRRDFKNPPSLPWRLATLLQLPVTQPAQSQAADRWVNYYGPPGRLPAISYYEALEQLEAGRGQQFRDKIVFVGGGSTAGYVGDERDAFPNPYSWLSLRQSPGVDVHATVFLNLLRGDWLRRAPPGMEIAIIALAGVLAGLGLASRRPWAAAGLGLAGALFVLALATYLFWRHHFWFPWAVICVVQIPAAVLGSLLFRAQRSAVATDRAMTTEFSSAGAAGGDPAAPHVPDHELLRCIGRGSYGDVWLARSVMGTPRAVKVVWRKSFGEDRRFEREFEGLKKFEPVSRQHEGLVDILHAGRNDAAGCFYYVMELADDANDECRMTNVELPDQPASKNPHSSFGIRNSEFYTPRTLRSEMDARRRLPLNECLHVGLALTSALNYLHQQGLIHRDIKPSNIIFVGGLPKLADIGLVAGVEEARSFVGTEGYIPPEGPGTPQADLFSLGKVLYELSTGLDLRQFPEGPTLPDAPAEAEKVLRLHEMILRACEQDLARRYASAGPLNADLLRLLGGV